ncbi:MAG: DUF1801 domain-containing protein [Chitinophagaceae bacterium]|nr:DUF1801 domain-containing protein [Chitinophagaceae bacterium]
MIKKPLDTDEYIGSFPKEIQKILKEIRMTIRKAAPGAQETIKYAMPTFVQDGNLVFFAAFNKHIGFYPAPTGIEAYKKLLAPYKTGKGSIQFPLDKPMPLSLITKIVKWRVAENKKRTIEKSKK